MLQKIIFILVLFCFDRSYGLKRCEDCVFIRSCENVKFLENGTVDSDMKEKISNSLCDFQFSNRLRYLFICCSDFADFDISDKPGIEEDKITNHKNLALLPDDCGPVSSSRIIGGTKANLYEYPWMALLSFRKNGTGTLDFKCGGTIINSRYILTAAHCVGNTREELAGVRVGEYEIDSRIDCQGVDNLVCERHLQDLYVEKVIRHENFTRNTLNNDIALIRTRTPIDFGHRNVKPICLPVWKEVRNMDLSGRNAILAGWGSTEYPAIKLSNILRKIQMPIWNETDCRNALNNNEFDSMKILCAGEKGKMNSCYGDGGSPLMFEEYYKNMNRMIQFGIVSSGSVKCITETPGIYTDVTKYIYWILENIEA